MLAETFVTLAETLVTPAETFVHSGEATVKSTKSAAVETSAMEATKSAAVETSASAMRPGVGKIWLAERAGAQESSCGCQNLCRSWPGPMFA
jgi:hypothetical protein